MNETVQYIARHGYWILSLSVLGRQACLPIPTNLLLVAAGALARSGKLSLAVIIGLSVVSFVLADLMWYEAGRRLGDKVTHLICGPFRRHQACAGKATSRFERHGANTLLFSKFVIGVDAVAVPLAGASGLPMHRFLTFDALGAMFWSSTYAMLGYLFAHQLDLVAVYVARGAAFLAAAVVATAGFYLARKFFRRRRTLPRLP